MKTLQELVTKKRTDIRKHTEEERKELRKLEAIFTNWPPEVKISNIYLHNLYGVSADIKIGDQFQAHGKEDTRQTMEQVAELLDRFPPVPVYKIRDGCVSFRPDSDVNDELAMSDRADLVWGPRLCVHPGVNSGGAYQHLEWFTPLGDMLVEITAIIRPDCCPVRVNLDTRKDRRTGRVLEVTGCILATDPSFKGNFWLDQRVKWAAGSSEYANNFTCYWLAIDDSQGAGKAWLETICGIYTPNEKEKTMSMRNFIRKNRQELDRCIRQACENVGRLNDEDREQWIMNDEGLCNWARNEGVKV